MPRRYSFPLFPRDLFSCLEHVSAEEKFLLKNRSFGIAEMGIGFCNVSSGKGKTFFAKTFDSAQTFLLRPKWEISPRESGVFVARNLDDGEAENPQRFREELDTLLAEAKLRLGEKVPRIPPPHEIGGNWYLPTARKIIEDLEAGTLRKVVLARSIRSRALTPIPIAPILGKLHERFEKNCTIFSVTRDKKTFMGASPETLVRIQNRQLKTEALAGSVPNFPGADVPALAAQLLADDKERREHRAVVDFIAEKLRALGIEPQFPDEPEVVVLPNILHLRTPISAQLSRPIHILEIVETLHPTPAMCGTPTEKAREKILSTEPFSRGNFAGPLGFFDENGEGFFAVGIRCAEISGCEIQLFAGSGLVVGSVPEREFAEIDSKFAAVLAHIQS